MNMDLNQALFRERYQAELKAIKKSLKKLYTTMKFDNQFSYDKCIELSYDCLTDISVQALEEANHIIKE